LTARRRRPNMDLFAAEANFNQKSARGTQKPGAKGSGSCSGHFLDLARQLTSQALGRAILPKIPS
jgi:hypothetical protein